MDEGIRSQLKELSTDELIELQGAIRRILDEREVSEGVIKETIKYLASLDPTGGVRYTKLTLYLEKQGLRREAIARKVVEMWRKDPSIATGGCPIGEADTPENPIYPYVEGVKYWQICYLQKWW